MVSKKLEAGVIGLGAMGAPMARHLADAGLLGMVWNRTSNKAEALAQETGTLAADTPEQLASACNVILICVSADKDLLDVVGQLLPGVKPGCVVVDTSTVSPSTARQVSASLHEVGASLVDAPVSGGVEGANKGTLTVMAGGDSAIFRGLCQFLRPFLPLSRIWVRWVLDRPPRLLTRS